MLQNLVDENLVKDQYTVHDLICGRWSPRAFSNHTVERDKLLIMQEASRWAASCFNEQPWSFIIATKNEPVEYDRLLSCLVESNRSWAQSAPVLMLSVAKLHFDKNGKENRHAFHDVGAASCNLSTQATALDLFVHQMSGFDGEKARAAPQIPQGSLFGIPEGWEPVAMMAIGIWATRKPYPNRCENRNWHPESINL